MDNLKEAISVIKTLIIMRNEFKIRKESKMVAKSYTPFNINPQGADYLLGQFLRQVWLPKESHYVSEKAMEKWMDLGQTPLAIWDCFYQDKVTNNTNMPVKVDRYRGAETQPWNIQQEYEKYRQLNPKQSICYREAFHDDHITTIQSIKGKLSRLEVVDEESIFSVLKTIKVAKILKEEDRGISRLKRDLSEVLNDEVIKKYYACGGVVLKSFQEWEDGFKGDLYNE